MHCCCCYSVTYGQFSGPASVWATSTAVRVFVMDISVPKSFPEATWTNSRRFRILQLDLGSVCKMAEIARVACGAYQEKQKPP
jgi:hypothetical protein